MTARSPEQARKRYYLVTRDMSPVSGGLSFVNREAALVNGRLAGTHEHREPGHPHPVFVGIPRLREKPQVVIGGSGPTALDYYDLFKPIFISTRAKELLEGIDPGGFEFAECETVDRRGSRVKSYWWMDVIRWVETFDEERSSFEWYRDSYPMAPDAQTNPSMSALYDIHMPGGFPDEYHAFWFAHYRIKFVFDEVLVDAWREARLTGAHFTPLQPPTEAEFKDHVRFVNYPYWTEKARQS
ncbi:MAG TPA: DUF1629 domain-containing protein [Longimicrobium sp.]